MPLAKVPDTEYFNSFDYNHNTTIKVLFVGPQGSGKTSLLRHIINADALEKYTPTVGIDTGTFEKGGLKLQIWDTSGDPLVRSNSIPYYTGAHIIVYIHRIVRRIDDDTGEFTALINTHRYTTTKVLEVITHSDYDEIPYDIENEDRFVISNKTKEGIDKFHKKLYEGFIGWKLTHPDIFTHIDLKERIYQITEQFWKGEITFEGRNEPVVVPSIAEIFAKSSFAGFGRLGGTFGSQNTSRPLTPENYEQQQLDELDMGYNTAIANITPVKTLAAFRALHYYDLFTAAGNSFEDCPTCVNDITRDNFAMTMCGHIFCKECIAKSEKCALCDSNCTL